jgi:hypothetical protein
VSLRAQGQFEGMWSGSGEFRIRSSGNLLSYHGEVSDSSIRISAEYLSATESWSQILSVYKSSGD